MFVVSSSGTADIRQGQKAIEIKVACLPEEQLADNSFLPNDSSKPRSLILATWLLQQSTEIIDSVFSDWYEAFSGRSSFDINTVEQVCPCVQCLRCSLSNQYQMETSITLKDTCCGEESDPKINHFSWKHFCLFSSPYCVLMASRSTSLECPIHKSVAVDTIAPDLVSAGNFSIFHSMLELVLLPPYQAFYDLPAAMLCHDPTSLTTSDEPLGSGGFGSVYSGTLSREVQLIKSVLMKGLTYSMLTTQGRSVDVAVKMFSNPLAAIGKSYHHQRSVVQFADIEEEIAAWDVYLNSSREGRVMYQLQHPNILGLVGLAFQPLRLLLELAPRGDLKHCLKEFKEQGMRLNRRTLKAVMSQVECGS